MIELVGLAYDRDVTNRFWSEVPIRMAMDWILEDEFRRKVDLRSLLYHKGQSELFSELELCLKQGGESHTLIELIARRFAAGVEDFPTKRGELAFDFQLIRHFSSLAMVDDFLVADPFLRELLRKVGFLKDGAGWSLLEVRDFEGIASALRDLRVQDIIEVAVQIAPETPPASLGNLVGNYIEFLSYAKNNRLAPFFYNSQSDFRRWGDLAERKNQRNEIIVDLSLKGKKKKPPFVGSTRAKKSVKKDLGERMRIRRECDALLFGLSDRDPLIRQKAAESLGKVATADVIPELIRTLSDDHWEVRQEIVRALGAVESKAANAALLELIKRDEVASVRLTAAHMLCKKGVKEIVPLLLDAVEAGELHFGILLTFYRGFSTDRKAEKRLTTMAQSEKPNVRRDVAFLLGRFRSASTGKALSRLIEDDDENTRINSLYSIYHRGAKEALPFAKKLARHSSEATAQAGTIVEAWANSRR